MFDHLLQWLRQYVSPVFVLLLVASFVLWYIAKLNYTYTTDNTVRVNVDGTQFEVECVIEGLGTNLFGHRIKSLKIPLSELRYTRLTEPGREEYIRIDPQSLQNAISVRYSDVKIISVGVIPEVKIPVEP